MEKVPVHVMSLDSEEDDLEIVSENITNYGNCPTPVEVAPELQEKLKLSLEKLSSIPGKIKSIKVYAIKKKKNELGTIRASFTSANGKLGQVVNVRPVFGGIFSNQAKVVTNNNGVNRGHVQSPSTDSETTKTAKQPEAIEPIVIQDEISLTPPSPVILYSPIQKGKQCSIESLQNVTPSNQTPHKNGNSPDNGNSVSSQFFQCSRQERNQDLEMHASENFSRSQIITHESLSSDPLLLDKREIGVENNNFKNLFVNIRGKSNPVKLSPIKFSSDEEEEFKLDNSILDIWNTPKSNLEEESSIEQVDEFYPIDDMLDDMELDDSSRDFVETKDKCHDDHENSKIQVVKELLNKSEKKQIVNVEQCKQFQKCPSVDVERLPKKMLKFSGKGIKHSENDDSSPPQWTTIFPPGPPTLPPSGWMSSDNLWQLDATEFMEVTGLCGMERAVEVRRQMNAPKPRVLRKKRHKL